MVDARIYRVLLGLVAFAVIVFAFSLRDQRGSLKTTSVPGQFFDSVASTTNQLARQFPGRAPGSVADMKLAGAVRSQLAGLRKQGFSVRTQSFSARTAAGTQTLENVIASRPGIDRSQVVVVSERDATSLAGTAVMLDLANAVAGETLGRTVTLVSTSGSIGAAGATELARELSGEPVDAVIVLGDLTSTRVRQPAVVPWSGADLLAPPLLRSTLAHYLSTGAGIKNRSANVAGQFARLAFPFTITSQAPWAGGGLSAVLLSLSGDRLPTAASQPSDTSLPAASTQELPKLGTAVLETVNALDKGVAVGPPSSYLVLSGKVVPLWALRLLVLALILPVVATTVDALARTRRRGHSITRWLVWVLIGSVPFLMGLAVLLLAGVSGMLRATPPGAVGAHAIAIGGSGAAVMLGTLAVVVLSFVFLRPLCLRGAAALLAGSRRPQSPAADAAAVAVSVVMCVTVLVMWLVNPFAAALVVPALHLWMWMAAPSVRSHRPAVLLLALIAALPAVAVAVYYVALYGLSAPGLAWSLTLMVAGGAMPVLAAVYWSVVLGCFVSVLVIGVRSARAAASTPDPIVTVRGPASYAGPGSLGGTESALRR